GLEGEPLVFCAVPAADGGVAAFRTDAPSLREGLVFPLLGGFDLREGVAVRLVTPDRRPLDGGPAAAPASAVLASLPLHLPTGVVHAEAVLSDPALLDAEAARGRNLLLAVFAAAALALGLGSMLVIRMVRSEVRVARMKADFVSAVSHDLKTPLTSIRMFLETLREGRARTEEERRECLEVVDREAGRLERLVHRVLEFSRTSTGARRILREPADPAEVVRQAAMVFRGHLLNGECDFSVEAAEGIGTTPLDRDAVTQVVLDLLENAYKYTPGEGKRIRLRALPLRGGGVRIEVEDNGPGVPPEERRRVFEEFYRVERPGTEGAGGTGLGLALVKRLVEAHGGTVSVEEAPGGGSVFAVEIPADAGGG
ncbi:MAG: HAMP domain-containing histidine kinase, partial [Planctomycetes bacterium]|nr:HAMP domain-containing histidine kinase [Planctomycetota bacterium]